MANKQHTKYLIGTAETINIDRSRDHRGYSVSKGQELDSQIICTYKEILLRSRTQTPNHYGPTRCEPEDKNSSIQFHYASALPRNKKASSRLHSLTEAKQSTNINYMIHHRKFQELALIMKHHHVIQEM